MAKKIRAIMIVEIAGRPAEHVKESLISHIGQIKLKKEICVISQKMSAPRKIEEAEEELYTCFAEVEVEVDNFYKLTELVFDFMPSSVEIIEPNEISMSLSDATTYLNTLSGRLHKYDEIAKIAQMQVQQLAQRFQQMEKAGQLQNVLSGKVSPIVSEKKEEKKKLSKKKK
jgi:hypothetical protein